MCFRYTKPPGIPVLCQVCRKSRADGAQKVALAERIQQRLWDIGAFGVLGQFFEPVAFRSDLQGITAPMQFYWGVSRSEE